MSRNSAGPPFPCPPGMAWDGRRFYKLDPKLAKVRESPASRGSSPDTAPALPPEHESGTTPSSAFHFTPANPPAAFSRAQDGGVYAMPRSGPPCSATSRAYKRSRIQRHHASLRSHSRDLFSDTTQTLDLPPPGPDFSSEWRALGDVICFGTEGSMIWVKYDGWRTGWRASPQPVPICLDLSGRVQGGSRWLEDPEPLDLANFRPFEDHEQMRFQSRRIWVPWGVAYGESVSPAYIAALAIAHTKRGADALIDSQERPQEKPMYFEVAAIALAPRCDHRLCLSLTENFGAEKADPAASDLLFMHFSENDNGRYADRFDREYIAGASMCMCEPPPVPESYGPTKFYFTSAAMNEETAFCWVGLRSGSIRLMEAVRQLQSRSGPITDAPWHNAPQHGIEGAVTNLVAVGTNQVVALFSKGGMALLQANKRKPDHIDIQVVRTYVGHVNEGDMNLPVCAEPNARLFAARGIDGYIRIWHLDDPFPINGAWHQRRRPSPSGEPETLDLLPRQDALMDRLMNRSKPGASSNDTTLDASEYRRLINCYDSADAYEQSAGDQAGSPAPPIPGVPAFDLRTLKVKRSVRMAFTLPAWVADRDAQWQWSEELAEPVTADSPLFSQRGALPCLAITDSDEHSGAPTVVYFEAAPAQP